MKKTIIAMILFTLAFQSWAFAEEEPYQGSEFPPLELLAKIIPNKMEDKGKYLGKIELKEGTYLVYYQFPAGRVESVALVRLDTNYWIYNGKRLLMK